MKVFVAEKRKHKHISATNYHWCDNSDLLMFGQFQLGNGNPSEVGMCGINSRKFTTHIMIKDLNISKMFYCELLADSIEKSMKCKIDRNGNYNIDIAWGFQFNVYDIMNELLQKANKFDDGQKLRCFGRTLFKIIK